jgi:uncharacterized membrane protein YhhN
MIAFIKRWTILAYFLALFAFIAGGIIGLENLPLFTKPLLMPLLMLYVWVSMSHGAARNILLAALFFSFAGDVLLMLEPVNSFLFIPGLVAFLFTHILYIIYFFAIPSLKKSLLLTAPYLAIAVIIYGMLLLYFLFPRLGILKIPVLIYAGVILVMLLASMHAYNNVQKQAGMLFIAGALFFIISDSLLAINKFHTALIFPFTVILTYGIAQYLLVRGFIKHSLSPMGKTVILTPENN